MLVNLCEVLEHFGFDLAMWVGLNPRGGVKFILGSRATVTSFVNLIGGVPIVGIKGAQLSSFSSAHSWQGRPRIAPLV